MSRENVEVVRTVLAAMKAGDRERLLSFADPGIVLDLTRNALNPATYVGIDGLRRMLNAADDVWEDIHTEPAEFIDAGDYVVVVGRLIGRGRSSGLEVHGPAVQLWTVRGGRVVRVKTGYADRQQALDAVGLRE